MNENEDKIKYIKVKYSDITDDSIKSIIKNELSDAIDYFEKTTSGMCASYVSEIVVVSKDIKINSNPYIKGIFNSHNRILTLKYNGNINEFKNTIIHELSHAKFNTDLAVTNNNLWRKSLNEDSAIYMINEYMAIKLDKSYYYDIKDLQHINECQDNFSFYYRARKENNILKLKELATLICSIIVSHGILNKISKKKYPIYNKDILAIKNELEKMEFIPTEEQYISLVGLLKEKGYKEYNAI